ncbi:MAG: hypothetical protein QXN59_02885 [Candidatus Micrarchaeaceae archaeon]
MFQTKRALVLENDRRRRRHSRSFSGIIYLIANGYDINKMVDLDVLKEGMESFELPQNAMVILGEKWTRLDYGEVELAYSRLFGNKVLIEPVEVGYTPDPRSAGKVFNLKVSRPYTDIGEDCYVAGGMVDIGPHIVKPISELGGLLQCAIDDEDLINDKNLLVLLRHDGNEVYSGKAVALNECPHIKAVRL